LVVRRLVLIDKTEFLAIFTPMLGYLICGILFTTQPTIDTTPIEIPLVEISSSRLLANKILQNGQTSLSSKILLQNRNLTLGDALQRSSNLFTTSLDNYSQDLRLSMRGSGMRSAFGIRGIKIIVDGIPESTPDGQGDVDNIEVNLISKINILSGPANGVYSNASGGVIEITTASPNMGIGVNSITSIGSQGSTKIFNSLGFGAKKFNVLASYAHTRHDGYREHSKHKNNSGYIKLHYAPIPNLKLQWIASAFDSPLSQDPGGLTYQQVIDNPKAARVQNIQFNAGEEVAQWKTSGLAIWTKNDYSISAMAFTQNRDFTNRLAFINSGAVSFTRSVNGFQFQHQAKGFLVNDDSWQLGFDIDSQVDDRIRQDNNTTKTLRLSQLEQFKTIGAYLIYAAKLKRWGINGTIRTEQIEIDLRDKFLSDGDQSGIKSYNPITGNLGFSFDVSSLITSYVRITRGFETPTLTEIANNPSGGGFSSVAPATTRGYEIGLKMNEGNKFYTQIDAYQYVSDNELFPYQIATMPGRVFYQNGGESSRAGLEIQSRYQANKVFTLFANGSINRFVLRDVTTNGMENSFPGVPERIFKVGVDYSTRNVNSFIEFSHNDRIFADLLNKVKIEPQYGLSGQLSYQFNFWKMRKSLAIGGRYMLSDLIFNNILINAAGDRFFEPMTPTYFYGRLNISFLDR
jgi:iron complex outermembrane recepter protein